MYLNWEVNLNSVQIYLDWHKVCLNLRKRMIKFGISDIELLKFRQIFAEFKFISEFKHISEFKV